MNVYGSRVCSSGIQKHAKPFDTATFYSLRYSNLSSNLLLSKSLYKTLFKSKAGLRLTLRKQKNSRRLTFHDHTAPQLRSSAKIITIIYDLSVTAMILRRSETVATQKN